MASSIRRKVNNRTIKFSIWYHSKGQAVRTNTKNHCLLAQRTQWPSPCCEHQSGFLPTRQWYLFPAAPSLDANHNEPWTHIFQEPSFYPKLPRSHCSFTILGIWLSRIESVRNENPQLPFLLRKAETGLIAGLQWFDAEDRSPQIPKLLITDWLAVYTVPGVGALRFHLGIQAIDPSVSACTEIPDAQSYARYEVPKVRDQ